MFSLIINLAYVICELSDSNPIGRRCLGSCAVLIIWFKLFYFLKLFYPTASLVRMIIEIVKDMWAFVLVLGIAMVGYGLAFYVLSSNSFYGNPNNTHWKIEEMSFTGDTFWVALVYSFRTGLSDF